MAASQDISQFVTPEAEAGLKRNVDMMEKGVGIAAELTKNLKAASDALGSAKTLTDLAKAQTEAAKAQAALAQANIRLTQSETAIIKQLEAEERARKAEIQTLTAQTNLTIAQTRANQQAAKAISDAAKAQATATAAAERQAAADAKLNNGYEQLKKEYTAAANAAKQYYAELGKSNPTTVAAVKNAKALHDRLAEIESSVGQNQRNVGNYAGSLADVNRNVAMLASELPSLSNGFRTFASAIGNNLAPAIEAFRTLAANQKAAQQAAVEQAEAEAAQATATAIAGGASEEAAAQVGELAKEQALAAAEATKGPGVLKALASSIFSVGTLITVAITLFTVYAGAIANWVTELVNGKDESKEFNEAMKEVGKNMASDIAEMYKNIAVTRDLNATKREQIEAYKSLKEAFPQFLGQLTLEEIQTEKVNDAIKNQIELLTRKQRIEAGEKVLTKALEEQLEAQQNLDKFLNGGNRSWFATDAADAKEYANSLTEANKKVEDATKQLNGEVATNIEQNNKRIAEIDKWIAKETFMAKALNKSGSEYRDAVGALELYRAELVRVNEAAKNRSQTYDVDTDIKRDTELSQIRLNNAKKGTKEELKARQDVLRNEGRQRIADLIKEFNQERAIKEESVYMNEDFQRKVDLITSDTRRKIQDAEDTAAKKNVKRVQDTTNEVINIEERLNKASAELRQQRLQGNKEDLQAIFENEQEGLATRISAREEFYQKELQQQKVAAKAELDNIDVNLKKIAQLEGKGGKLSNEQKNLVIQKKAFETERLVITDKYAALKSKSEREKDKFTQDAITKDLEKQISTRRKLLDNNIADMKLALSEQEYAERDAINKKYASGNLNETEYRKQIANINKKYDLKELESSRDLIEQNIKDLKALGADTEAEDKKLADARIAINAERHRQEEEDDIRSAERRKAIMQGLKALAEEIANSLVSITRSRADAEIERLQKQQEEIDKLRDKEVAAIEAVTFTEAERQELLKKYGMENASAVEKQALYEEEKQRKIILAEARAQAQREQLQEKQRAIQKRQAQFERGITIAQIIAKTAEAVVANLVKGGPVLAGIAAAIGAIQIATVLATPLPEYALGAGIPGRPKHKGGLARVGESGAELIIEPGRRPYMVDSDQVRDLPRNTIVAPQDRINALGYGMLNAVVSQRQQGMTRQDNSDIVGAVGISGSRIERAIRSTAPKGSTGVEKWYEWQKYNRR